MAKIIEKAVISYEVAIALSEQEAKALHAITVYGADYFLKMFYEHLGQDKLKPHEKGLRELFASVSNIMPGINNRISEARKIFYKEGE